MTISGLDRRMLTECLITSLDNTRPMKTKIGSLQLGQTDFIIFEQETQLMLTNPRDAFRGHSRSPNIVPFITLGILPLMQ